MPFGAHETMEVHECLMEKINLITHFNLYAKEAKNPQLLDMIMRHQQEEMMSYNEIVGLTRGNSQFNPIPPNTNVSGINNQHIQYGLNNPPQFTPNVDASLNDQEIAIAMLLCHKNAARNCTQATLECADPNLRRAMLNSAASCMNQAYEVFLFMNEQGLYQVPTMKNQTTQTFLNSYQPANSSFENQYNVPVGMQNGAQNGYYGQSNYAAGSNLQSNMVGPGANNGNFSTGSENSVLYGNGGGGTSGQYGGASQSMNGSMNSQGMQQ